MKAAANFNLNFELFISKMQITMQWKNKDFKVWHIIYK